MARSTIERLKDELKAAADLHEFMRQVYEDGKFPVTAIWTPGKTTAENTNNIGTPVKS